MQSPKGSRLARLVICGIISVAGFTTACSDDGANDDEAAATGEDTSEWCAAARQYRNAIPSEQIETMTKAAELAPDDLKADYQALIDLMQYKEDNPVDAVGYLERQEAIAEPFARLLLAVNEECGVTL